MSNLETNAWMRSRRFWLLAVAILLINNVAWFVYQHRQTNLNLLRVERFEPGLGSLEANARPPLLWRFNLAIADRRDEAPPVSIKPALAGKFTWDDDRTLRFVPRDPLPVATQWELTVLRDRVKSVEGCTLADDFRQGCQTAALTLLSVRQTSFSDQAVSLELKFNDLVLPSDLQARLMIVGDARPLPVHVREGKPSSTITAIVSGVEPTAKDRDLTVLIRQGLSAHTGLLGLSRDTSMKVPITTELVLNHADGESASDSCSISLNFNGAVEATKLAEVLTVEPKVPGFRCEQSEPGEITLRGPFQAATRYALKIAAPPGDTDKTDYPRPETRTVFIPDIHAQLGFDSNEGYLGAAGRRTAYAWAVNTQSADVEIYRLYDSNLVPWANDGGRGVTSQGRLVARKTLRLQNRKNVREEIPLKLDELLTAEHRADGVFEIRLKPTPLAAGTADRDRDEDSYYGSGMVTMQLALSDIGLTVKRGEGQIVACAISLSKATPLDGTRVRVFSTKNQLVGEGVTAADGTVEITLQKMPDNESPSIVVADREMDGEKLSTTWLHLDRTGLNLSAFNTSGRPYLRHGFEAFVYNDRGVYRPGETVGFHAIIRGPDGTTPPQFPVQWVLIDPRGKSYEGGTSMIDADGATRWDWPTSDGTLTGPWRVQLRLANHDRAVAEVTLGGTQIQVEDFMPDRLKVDLKLGETGEAHPHVSASGELLANVRAAYLFGQAGAGLKTDITATAQPAVFSSDSWKSWTFNDEGNVSGIANLAGMKRQLPKAELTLDDKGNLHYVIAMQKLLASEKSSRGFDQVKDKASPAYRGAWRINVEAAVHDISGRAITRYADAFVDPSADYIGLRTTALSGVPGTPATFEVALVDPSGQLRHRDADLWVSVFRVVWNNTMTKRDGRYVFESTQVLRPVEKDAAYPLRVADGRAIVRMTPPSAGRYVVCVADRNGGPLTSRSFEVLGRDWADSVSRENPEKLEVMVLPQNLGTVSRWIERSESWKYASAVRPATSLARQWLAMQTAAAHVYKPGEWASVVVKSPFAGTLLLTVETDRVIERRTIAMSQSAVTVPVQIDERCRPNVYISASVVRAIDPTVAWRTHRAYGLAAISIAAPDRKLTVAVTSPPEIKPGHTLPVRLLVKDSSGKPVANAAVTVAAVDEGILQLTGFATPEPFSFFTAKRALAVNPFDVYGSLVPDGARSLKTGDVGGDEDLPASRYKPPVGARRVKPVAISSELHTDPEGFAQADFPLPQFSGQLRLMAVAYAGPAVGSSQGVTLVRSSLVVQSSWPRFAAPGDQFDVPVTIFNTSAQDGAAAVHLRLEGPLQTAVGDAADLIVPAGKQQTYLFHVTASPMVGVARAVVTATMNGESASDEVELPVRPASPMLTYGGVKTALPGEPINLDPGLPLLPGTGQYRLRVASQPELILPQGLDYLNSYPYGCCEQTVSGLFPLIALRDLGQQIDPVLFNADDVAHKVNAGIARLVLLQRGDGSLAMWPDASYGWPHASLYAAHFVTAAESAGYHVPAGFRDRLFAYLRSLLNESVDEPDALENQAYACYVLAIAGRLDQADRVAMERLTQVVSRPPITPELTPSAPTRFMLSAAWLAIQHRTRADGLIPDVFPKLRTTRQLSGNIGSPVSDRAMILSTLLTVQPDHPSVTPMVEQLVELGRAGEWRSTQDVSLALLALGQYQRKFKDVKPFATAELRRGVEQLAASADGKELTWRVPNSFFATHTASGPTTMPSTQPANPLTVAIDGPPDSRGYISWVQTGVPLKPPADETSKGISIRRRFLTPDGSEEIAPGRLTSGQLVRVELTLTAARNFECVVVEDLLPAGLEIENPRLNSSTQMSDTSSRRSSRSSRTRSIRVSPVFDINSSEQAAAAANATQVTELKLDASPDIRDDRIVLFTSLQTGVAKYEYLTRAITVGTFVMPPVRAECMYDLATFSLTGSGTMSVVAEKPSVIAVEETGRADENTR